MFTFDEDPAGMKSMSLSFSRIIVVGYCITRLVLPSMSQTDGSDSTAQYLAALEELLMSKTLLRSSLPSEVKSEVACVLGDCDSSQVLVEVEPTNRSAHGLSYRCGHRQVQVQQAQFDSTAHRIERIGNAVLTIDDRIKVGCLTSMPMTVVGSIRVSSRSFSTKEFMATGYVLCDPRLACEEHSSSPGNCTGRLLYSKRTENLYLYFDGGDDGSAFYAFVLVIDPQGSLSEVIYRP